MAIRRNVPKLIEEFNKVHSNAYEYDLFIYLGNSILSIITCKTHGHFLMVPANHKNGQGCPECAKDVRAKKKLLHGEKNFKLACEKIHPNAYDWSSFKYLGAKVPTNFTCSSCQGVFPAKPDAVKAYKHPCPFCRDTTPYNKVNEEMFMQRIYEKFSVVQGDPKLKFLSFSSLSSDVIINCPIHKKVFVSASKLYSYQGNKTLCPECYVNHSFSRTRYLECSKSYGGLSNLYILSLIEDGKIFYKIGIALRGVRYRLRNSTTSISKNKVKLPLKEVLFVIKGDAELIWNLEKFLHKSFKPFKYKPTTNFIGYTECFSSIDGILDHIPFDQVEVITDLLSQQEIAA